MHDNPLSVYREYVQNAVDAMDTADITDGRVEIEIDPVGMRVRIRDNGPGLFADEAAAVLLPIAHSRKRRGGDRGFRGIGRLSALAFAESVTFRTRAAGGGSATLVAWNGAVLRGRLAGGGDVGRAILDSVKIDTTSCEGYPERFFEVEIAGIGRHAAGTMLNRHAARAYIAETCPVPMSREFPFTSQVQTLVHGTGAASELEIVLAGEPEPVTRPHGAVIRFSEEREDRFVDFKTFRIPAVDRSRTAAVGWIAHSSYLGAIPKAAKVRGIRAREGNIQIGGENVFAHLFTEERFNLWCVGEIHVLDPRIVPNGRRDYFEPSPHTRNLENQLGRVFQEIASCCRTASAARNKGRRLLSDMRRIEDAYELAVSGYLAPDDATETVELALARVPDFRRTVERAGGCESVAFTDLDELERKLRAFTARREAPFFAGITDVEVKVWRNVFRIIARTAESPGVAKKTIEDLLAAGALVHSKSANSGAEWQSEEEEVAVGSGLESPARQESAVSTDRGAGRTQGIVRPGVGALQKGSRDV